MKLLIYIASPLALVLAAMKWDWLAMALVLLFALGGVGAVVFSLFRLVSSLFTSNHTPQ